MNSPVLHAARIDFSGAAPRSLDFDDVYHSAQGAQGQARHVFLGGNELPGRWAGHDSFCILETGFGLGHNFLATWRAWRADPQRCDALNYWAVERHPPLRADLERAHIAHQTDGGAGSPIGTPAGDDLLAQALCDAWPPLVPGVHGLSFDEGRVRLWLAFGDARTHLPRCVGRFDAFFLDGFAPDRNPDLWDDRVLQSLARLAAPQATAATWSVAGAVRAALSRAGFEVERRPGFGGKKQMLAARYRPHHRPDPPPGRPASPVHGPRSAVIVGAGLAGAAVAHALACRGWRCTVLDKSRQPAMGASGNPAGLLHATVHRQDGLHSRLHRAGALCSARQIAPWIADGRVDGNLTGLLAVLQEAAFPVDQDIDGYAQRLDARQASQAAGIELHHGALQYVEGGWVDPAALVRAWLDHPSITVRTDVEAARVRPCGAGLDVRSAAQAASDPARAPCWAVEDPEGQVLGQASIVVLAAGADLPALAGLLGLETLPWQTRRGQIDWCRDGPTLRQPLTGQGYAVSLPDGRLLFGATSAESDRITPSDADTEHNRSRLQMLTGHRPRPGQPGGGSRVSRRLGMPDRLPVVGPLPRRDADTEVARGSRRDQVRFIPRQPGLFVCGGFGSRGLTWAPLAAQVICAWLEGSPMPLEADLLDAIDPARWQVRAYRRAAVGEAVGEAEGQTPDDASAPGGATRQAAATGPGPAACASADAAGASPPSPS
jgi:tRNA 5-methylaminomethyl-2-thiouridine biosynthesis bifunctional protein